MRSNHALDDLLGDGGGARRQRRRLDRVDRLVELVLLVGDELGC